jgi:hypothetical protein
MSRWASRPGIAAGAAGAAIAAQLAIGRLALDADQERVSILGRPIDWVCALRRQYGLPCPTCGITRSVVLSLHGRFGEAWRLAPVGLVVVWGLAVFAAAMLALAAAQWVGAKQWERRVQSQIRQGAWVYAAGVLVVWAAGWTNSFLAALQHK